jgi:hypothetical protein
MNFQNGDLLPALQNTFDKIRVLLFTWRIPMGFFSNLFKAGEDPESSFTDPVLGEMKWAGDDEGDESWIGTYNGFKFAISYDRKARPDESDLAFAREFLSEPAWLNSALAAAKQKHKEELSPKLRAFYTPEIDELAWELIRFSKLQRGKDRSKHLIIVDLAPIRDRSWYVEFIDRTCHGLGFDS